MNNKLRYSYFDSIPILFLLVLSILIAWSFRSNPFYIGNALHDSSMFQYFGRLMTHGKIPYVDMFDHKGPLLFFINALGRLSFHGIRFLWPIEIFSIFITFLFSYLTNRFFLSRTYATLSTALVSVLYTVLLHGGNYSEEYALPFISIAIFYLALFYIKEDYHLFNLIILGISGTCVFFLRANMVIIWVIGCISILIYTLYRRNLKLLGKSIIGIFIGALVVILPILIYCLKTNSLYQMIYQSIIFNYLYVQHTPGIKFQDVTSFFAYILGQNGLLITLFFLPAMILFKKINFKTFGKKYFLYMMCMFGWLNLLSILLSQRNYPHYLATEIPFIIFSIALLIALIQKYWHYKEISLVLLILGTFIIVAFPALKTTTDLIQKEQTPTLYSKNTSSVASFIKRHTRPSDPIYIHQADANIYNIAKRSSNSRFFTLPSVNLDKFPKLRAEFDAKLIKNKPKYIVVKNTFLAHSSDRKYETNLKNLIKYHYRLAFHNYYYAVYGIH
ncbi:hypothetical protein [Pediococcus cellicola]|uniref:Glycosyltransferase RgtA/B/C/D-like domain-containing protein n=1 Tax=Pediococcus cellicola TaxID=319652 RepID=A0A0R2ITY6_9LACO|nr:hypothetical protein [Pediococcus cellicola]KRN65242.1 hypothetical protein IV80_GL000451 [Pediococcus cellicola]GEL15377.1 hypothetical protein PCE01_11790 [Pediococcus cellicola]